MNILNQAKNNYLYIYFYFYIYLFKKTKSVSNQNFDRPSKQNNKKIVFFFWFVAPYPCPSRSVPGWGASFPQIWLQGGNRFSLGGLELIVLLRVFLWRLIGRKEEALGLGEKRRRHWVFHGRSIRRNAPSFELVNEARIHPTNGCGPCEVGLRAGDWESQLILPPILLPAQIIWLIWHAEESSLQ